MVIIVLRTRKIPLFQSFPSLPVVLSSIIIILLGLMLVLVGADPIFASLRFNEGYILLGSAFAITSCYVIIAQLAKTCYVKAFKAWL
jgi:Mg2+-importing ATPase